MAMPAGAPQAPGMTNAPGIPPAMPPAAPAKEVSWTPVIIGLLGGLMALIGGVLPWLEMRTCVSTIIQICVAVPLPFALGSLSPILGIGQILALVFGLIGLVLLFLQKPMTGMVAGVMGILALVFAVLYFVTAPAYFTQLSGGVVDIQIGLGFGIYITMIGGVLLLVGGLMQWKGLKAKAGPKTA